jgi:hypothetical protein
VWLTAHFVQADASVTDPQVAADLKKKRTFRTFSYRGVELDKLLDLSNEEVCIVASFARKVIIFFAVGRGTANEDQ